MNVTHVFCPRCNGFHPIITSQIKTVTLGRTVDTFEGLEIKCRSCQFEVTKMGTFTAQAYGDDPPKGGA